MIYLLNSPILTGYGRWEFWGPIDAKEAGTRVSGGFTSAIGHQGTAEFLSALLDVTVPVNRIRIEMEPGDCALVVRILERMPEGKVLSKEDMNRIPYELGILTRRS